MNKKTGLILVIIAIIAVIWYLENIKAQVLAPGASQAPQEIGISSENPPAPTGVDNTGAKTIAPGETLQSVAALDKKEGYHPAIEIAGPTGFINTTPDFKLANLVGKKVVLLDFWTYSCINCIRTLPYLTSWYEKYHDQGLEIVGIHTPEFEFEKNYDNVKMAVQKYGIRYPVILDSNQGTWNAYENSYWPHEYLIDIAGYIAEDHIGEGGYDQTEAQIQKLLQERATVLGMSMPKAKAGTSITPTDLSGVGSPETYFGASRNEYLANGKQGVTGTQTLMEPQNVSLNQLYLAGQWNFDAEYATNAESGAKIIYKYNSAKVFLVASSAAGASVEVLEDGKPVSSFAGSDVVGGKVQIKESRLYSLIDNPSAGEHTLELIIDSPGLEAYTFTFG